MTKKLQHVFALSEKGAKDLVKAVIWCFVCNVSLMLPVGAVLFTVQHLLDSMKNGNNPVDGFWIYVGFGVAVLFLLLFSIGFSMLRCIWQPIRKAPIAGSVWQKPFVDYH